MTFTRAGVYNRLVKGPLRALVIDDEPQVAGFVADVLAMDGWNVSQARSAEEAMAIAREGEWPLVFCDVVLGGSDGYSVLRSFSKESPDSCFVLMTGHASAAGALDATAIGASEYLVKPFGVDEILRISAQVRQRTRDAARVAPPGEDRGYRSDIDLIGKSPVFIECLKLVGRVSSTNLPVLITGESGTGKEMVARAVHLRSSRATRPFITINCGAIPDELIESELFGYVRGSFTGAERERTGLWEEANGGTIFLDEITETSPRFQVKLLRALQEGEIRKIGSNHSVKVDVRVIAATNRDIEEEVLAGHFRQDLMYRLNAVTIALPPLRERIDDISILATHFARTARPDAEISFSDSVIDRLKAYHWPGNIRELENVVVRAVSLSEGTIVPGDLPPHLRVGGGRSDVEARHEDQAFRTLAEVEADYVLRVLESTDGNKQAAARILNIDRKTLGRILERAGAK